jgi:hypothetical protein
MPNVEVITYKGIRFRRYPDAANWPERSYYTPGIADRQKGAKRLHEEIWMDANGPIPEGAHIHHADHDPLNNDPGNLLCLTEEEHAEEHRESGRERSRTPEALAHLCCVRQAVHHQQVRQDAHVLAGMHEREAPRDAGSAPPRSRGACIMSGHPTRRIKAPDGTRPEIDVEMVPLIRSLWDRGFETVGCCQDTGESARRASKRRGEFWAGYALLEMPVDDGLALLDQIRLTPQFRERMHWAADDGWDMHAIVIAGPLMRASLMDCIQFRFPKEQVAELAEVIGELAAA